MKPLVLTDRHAAAGAALLLAWLASIELGTSRAASRAAEGSADRNEAETVVDTTTSKLFDGAAVIGLVTGVAASVLMPHMTIRARRTSFGAGLVSLLAAGGLSSVARRHLGRFHRDALTIHSDHVLVETGPYRYVRHPLYLATTAASVGIGAVLGNWVSLGMASLPTAALVHRIAVEERMLVERLGTDYVSYQERTERMVPHIW